MKHIKIIWFHERIKNPGAKLPASLKKGFYKAKKKPNLSLGPKSIVIRRHESLKYSKVFTFYKKKQVPTGIELLEFVFSSMGIATV